MRGSDAFVKCVLFFDSGQLMACVSSLSTFNERFLSINLNSSPSLLILNTSNWLSWTPSELQNTARELTTPTFSEIKSYWTHSLHSLIRVHKYTCIVAQTFSYSSTICIQRITQIIITNEFETDSLIYCHPHQHTFLVKTTTTETKNTTVMLILHLTAVW